MCRRIINGLIFGIAKAIFMVGASTSTLQSQAQTLLNGSFELNSAPTGVDQLNLSNNAFNGLVSHCRAFGLDGPANLDLITSSNWGGPPMEGNWYVGLQGGGTDQFSLDLTQPLMPGVTYRLSFYDRIRMHHCSTPVQIGVSNAPDLFGLLVYTSPSGPTAGEWRLRVATFTVPYVVEYITVRAQQEYCWVQVDDFCLTAETGCMDYPVLTMPNIFTPNNDGVNDAFGPMDYSGITEIEFTVTSRWGNIVHSSINSRPQWDGTFNGMECSDGVYFWMITYTDLLDEVVTKKGSVMLVRDR